MDEINIVVVVIGGTVLLLGLFSDYFRRNWWASDPLTTLLLGILVGPVGLGAIDPARWDIAPGLLLEQTARLTLAVGLMGVALRIPKGYIGRNWRSLLVLLGLVMPGMWLLSGLLIYVVFPLSFWSAMLIGAALAPTDPIVSNSIVTGVIAEQNLPPRLRHLISTESGLNDGLAYPFVLLSLLMLERSPIAALGEWMTRVILWEVIGAILLGTALGVLAGWSLRWAERHQTIERQSFLGYTLALSLTVLGVVSLLGMNGILAVFISGIAFDALIGGKERAEEENIQEAINRFLTLPIFVLLGTILPWRLWLELGWQNLLILTVLLLLLRRMPSLLLFSRWIKPIKNQPEAFFMGWFGPVGIAALFYAGYVLRHHTTEWIWPICAAMICASILAQGLSAVPLTRRYRCWYELHHSKLISKEGDSAE